jgi:hypothetical protein
MGLSIGRAVVRDSIWVGVEMVVFRQNKASGRVRRSVIGRR